MSSQHSVLLFLLMVLFSADEYSTGDLHSAIRNPQSAMPVNRVGKTLPVDAAPPAQQVLRYLVAEPKTLDVTTRTYEAGGETTLFETLNFLDINNELVPGAADRWESSKDGKTWTFHLRRTGRWSDGRPVTARDFEYSFKRSLSPAAASIYAFFYYDIKGAKAFNTRLTNDVASVGVRALDDWTLAVETERPCPYLPYVMTYPGSSPVPRWQVEKYGDRWTEPGKCVSNSSYQLASWDLGDRMVFTLNPYYRGPFAGSLEKIIRIFMPPGSAAIGTAAYENGEIDLHTVDAVDLDRIRRNPMLSRELVLMPTFTTWYVFFQTQKPPFNNLLVHQAIAHAINREALCATILRGTGIPAYTMRGPGFPGYAGPKLRDAQRYDPALARTLLARAGYPGGKGFPAADLWLRGPTATTKACAEAIQGMLRDVLRITVQIRSQETKVYMDNMYQYTIPMSLIPFGADYPDPNALLNVVWHSQLRGHGRHDWKNDRYDRLIDTASVELNPVRRMQQYEDAERILVSDVGGVFVYHEITPQLRKPYLGGFMRNRFGDFPLPHLSMLYIKRRR